MTIERLPERLARRIRIEAGDCWVWTGQRSKNGYGSVWWQGRTAQTHRVIYALLVGPIPAGAQLDHLCRTRACQNPAHLEPVSQAENIRRGDSPSAIARRTNQCKRGHEFTAANTYHHPTAGRICRICNRIRTDAYRQRRRQATTA